MTSRRLHARPALTMVLTAALHEDLRDAVNSDALEECRNRGWLEPDSWTLTRDGKKLVQQMGLD